jgi:hypothetical protein
MRPVNWLLRSPPSRRLKTWIRPLPVTLDGHTAVDIETPLRPLVSSISAPKLDARREQCRDAVFPPNGTYVGDRNMRALRCAIADGASYGYRCGQWAQILAREACAADPFDVDGLLSASVNAWELDIENYVVDRETRREPLQWFEQKNLRHGAFSTLLVLDLLPYREDIQCGLWLGRAVGDSCVFQIPAGEVDVYWAHPLRRPEQFGTRPELVPTSRRALPDVERSLNSLADWWWHWDPGDRFYLCTDALAEWFLRSSSDGGTPWSELDDLLASSDSEVMARWLERRVEQRAIHNDDVSVMRIVPM